jgi:hypothetical protein
MVGVRLKLDTLYREGDTVRRTPLHAMTATFYTSEKNRGSTAGRT